MLLMLNCPAKILIDSNVEIPSMLELKASEQGKSVIRRARRNRITAPESEQLGWTRWCCVAMQKSISLEEKEHQY